MKYLKKSYEEFANSANNLIMTSSDEGTPYDNFDLPENSFVLTVKNGKLIVFFKDWSENGLFSKSFKISKENVKLDDLSVNLYSFVFNDSFYNDNELIINILYFMYSKVALEYTFNSIVISLSAFFSFGHPPDKKLVGLLGELVFIYNSKIKNSAVSMWHSSVNDTYDFSSEGELFEVKTTTGYKRIHSLSSSQIESSSNAVIVSIRLLVTESGSNLYTLIDGIEPHLDVENKEKFKKLINETIGENKEFAKKFTFDLPDALESLRYYSIPNITILTDYPFVETYNISMNFTNTNTLLVQ